jgi:acetoin utilization protein AcuC
MPSGPPTVVWDDRFLDYDFGADHPFSERPRALAVRLLERLLRGARPGAVGWMREVPPADRDALERFHESAYLDFVEEAGLAEFGRLLDGGDTPAFPGCYAAAARIVEGARRAFGAVREHRAPAFHPAGGLHHAGPGRASGFCIFNDAAIAIAEARRAGLSVAYVDIDAHHGDGVMYGFYDSGRVLDIDFHQDGRTLFPGTGFPEESGTGDGAGAKVNLPLPPLAGDDALLPLFRRVAVPLLREFRPELIVLQHGVDGHVGDPLARLQYSPAAYAEIDRTLLELARELCDGRILVTGGGGYAPASVSRVLAFAGAMLVGATAPEADEALPEEWRKEFAAATGDPAPADWTSRATRVDSG